METYTRRQFLSFGAVTFAGLAVGGALSACGDNGKASSSQLEFSLDGTTEQIKAMQDVVSAYHRDDKGANIQLQFSSNGYYDKLATRVASGNPPDLIFLTISYIADYAQRGVLLPLDKYVPKPISLSDVSSSLVKAGGGTVNGKLYGLPAAMGTSTSVVYDKTVFDQIGIQPPGDDWTLDDLQKLAVEIAGKLGKGHWGTQDIGGKDYVLEMFVRGRGHNLYDGQTGQLAFTRDDFAAYLAYWDKMRKSGAVPPADVTAAVGHGADLLQQGKAPIGFLSTSGNFAREQSQTKNELAFLTFPKNDSSAKVGQYVAADALWAVAARSTAKDEACRFYNFLLNDSRAVKLIGFTRGVPPSTKSLQTLTSGGAAPDSVSQKMIDQVKLVEKRQDVAGSAPRPYPAGAGQLTNTLLPSLYEDYAFGKKTATEVSDAFFAKAKDLKLTT